MNKSKLLIGLLAVMATLLWLVRPAAADGCAGHNLNGVMYAYKGVNSAGEATFYAASFEDAQKVAQQTAYTTVQVLDACEGVAITVVHQSASAEQPAPQTTVPPTPVPATTMVGDARNGVQEWVWSPPAPAPAEVNWGLAAFYVVGFGLIIWYFWRHRKGATRGQQSEEPEPTA